ncbi:Zn-ribbon domain-containing OB-fold protein [Nocardia sp. NPDC055029]
MTMEPNLSAPLTGGLMSTPTAQPASGGVGRNPVPGREGTLMIRHCTGCDKLFAPLTNSCVSCASERLAWVPSAGTGTIVSWRLVDRFGPHGELMPLTIAVVELDEGPWVYTSIEGGVSLDYGRHIRVHFQPVPQQDRFPVFAVCVASEGSGCRYPSAGGGGETWRGCVPCDD